MPLYLYYINHSVSIKDCSYIRMTSGDGGLDCSGLYQFAPDLKAFNAPDYPVYKQVSEHTDPPYIFYSAWHNTNQWVCSTYNQVINGNYHHASK